MKINHDRNMCFIHNIHKYVYALTCNLHAFRLLNRACGFHIDILVIFWGGATLQALHLYALWYYQMLSTGMPTNTNNTKAVRSDSGLFKSVKSETGRLTIFIPLEPLQGKCFASINLFAGSSHPKKKWKLILHVPSFLLHHSGLLPFTVHWGWLSRSLDQIWGQTVTEPTKKLPLTSPESNLPVHRMHRRCITDSHASHEPPASAGYSTLRAMTGPSWTTK